MKKDKICCFDEVKYLDLIWRNFDDNKSRLPMKDVIGISKVVRKSATTFKFVRTRSNNWITSDILREIS